MKTRLLVVLWVLFFSFVVFARDSDGIVTVDTYSITSAASIQAEAYFLTINYNVKDRRGNVSHNYKLDIDLYMDNIKIAEVSNVYRSSDTNGNDRVTVMFFPRPSITIIPQKVQIFVEAEDLSSSSAVPQTRRSQSKQTQGNNISPQ